MIRIFRTRTFSRWLRKSGLGDAELRAAVDEMLHGLIDAELGGHVLKKRVALPGGGKRGGARTLVATNRGSRWYFVFGFEKNERANIDREELAALQQLAGDLLGLDATAIQTALDAGVIVEITE